MVLRDQIQTDQTVAMKARDSEKLSTLRMIWSAIRNQEINERKELDEDGVISVIARQIKQLRDSIEDFRSGGRVDLVEKTQKEVNLLESYLPAQLGDDELEQIAKKVIADLGTVSATDVGRIVGVMMKQVKGKADGNRVRAVVVKLLP